MSEYCKCFLSCELEMVPNGNAVGCIGVYRVKEFKRHYNRMCEMHK